MYVHGRQEPASWAKEPMDSACSSWEEAPRAVNRPAVDLDVSDPREGAYGAPPPPPAELSPNSVLEATLPTLW
eukprot:CAMPEP_0178460874 /NCGR_PEP_ID=MMETSP0689_2-20121128/48975_1 /TAXON_ID=160604 /ORGANISM="Amphidinium massartii, Strain CS-259" /LENGTH=72 /DNA_ID=CAMNT_0020087605 /DNA_START=85 /DNA_END=300 /DNA_ORIENTATION=-